MANSWMLFSTSQSRSRAHAPLGQHKQTRGSGCNRFQVHCDWLKKTIALPEVNIQFQISSTRKIAQHKYLLISSWTIWGNKPKVCYNIVIYIYIYICIMFRSEVWLVSEEWKTSKLCAKLGVKRVELTAEVSQLRTDFIKIILQKKYVLWHKITYSWYLKQLFLKTYN